MTNWDQRFFDMASLVAGWSKDPSTKVGAVIVNDLKQVLSIGYNGFPRGITDNESRYENRACKHNFVIHAERNALDNAFCDVGGASLYVTHFPCNECSKGIVQKGIKRLFTPLPDQTKEYIKDTIKHTASMTLLTEGRVEINYLIK